MSDGIDIVLYKFSDPWTCDAILECLNKMRKARGQAPSDRFTRTDPDLIQIAKESGPEYSLQLEHVPQIYVDADAYFILEDFLGNGNFIDGQVWIDQIKLDLYLLRNKYKKLYQDYYDMCITYAVNLAILYQDQNIQSTTLVDVPSKETKTTVDEKIEVLVYTVRGGFTLSDQSNRKYNQVRTSLGKSPVTLFSEEASCRYDPDLINVIRESSYDPHMKIQYIPKKYADAYSIYQWTPEGYPDAERIQVNEAAVQLIDLKERYAELQDDYRNLQTGYQSCRAVFLANKWIIQCMIHFYIKTKLFRLPKQSGR